MPKFVPIALLVASCASSLPSANLDVRSLASRERSTVERYFGSPFAREFAVEVFADRASFDRSLPSEWGLAPTQCWMVACGVGDSLRALDPAVWRTQACEHDGRDAEHVRWIVVHELVHVFHGQRNPSPDFSDAQGLDWFVEGLAVLASGQLESGHLAPAAEALAAGLAPADLASAWSGKHRYAVCGTLVRELERRCGRARMLDLLAARTNEELLAAAGVSEAELLAGWREHESR
jgi:hypothetical protein